MGTLIFLSVLVALYLLWVTISWGSLLLEKRRPLVLSPAPPDDPRINNSYAVKMRTEAETAGFTSLGTFIDSDPGWRQGILTIMLSSDGTILLMILHSKLLHKLILLSPMTSDVWTVTMSLVGDPDCSGLSAEEAVPTSQTLAPVLKHHRGRLEGRESEIIPWNPLEVVGDLQERDRRKAERLIETGAARWSDQMSRKWVYTFSGAARQRTAMKKFFKQSIDAAKAEAEEKKRAKKDS